MIINHNMASLNTYRQMSVNEGNTSGSLAKLSSGLRINKAGDDAAGLAISEKMRGQIRGLDQAARNGQDGISMIQTAEGALNETHSILQRMRELAVQSSNDTNTSSDRAEIQKEVDELTKEVTRISNSTEFNTQKLINGGINDTTGIKSAKFHIGANASQDITLSINAMDANSLGISRDVNTAKVDDTNTAGVGTAAVDAVNVSKALAVGTYTVTVADAPAGTPSASSTGAVTGASDAVSGTANAATNVKLTYTASAATAGTAVGNATYANIAALNTALGDCSTTNKTLVLTIDGADKTITFNKNYSGAGAFTDWAAVKTMAEGALGTAATFTGADGAGLTFTSASAGASSKVVVKTDTSTLMGAAPVATDGKAAGAGASTWVATGDLTGTISGATNAVKGINIDITKLGAASIGDTVTVTGDPTSAAAKTAQLFDSAGTTKIGSKVTINGSTGGTYTIGDATTGQAKVTFAAGKAAIGSSTITVATDAASAAAKQADNTMSDASVAGGINVSTQSAASAAITTIQSAIETVSAERSKLGAYQNRLEHTISNLNNTSENITAAESRVRDVDMAKEMMNFQKNNILQQAAQAMLAQANQQPQGVLQLLR